MRKLAIILAAALTIAGPASAEVFDFSYTGSGIVASGTFVTTDTPDLNGYYTVTSIDGTRNGAAMSLLAPGTFPADGPNDNLVQPNTNMVDYSGIGYSTDQDYNLFQYSPNVYVECFATCIQGTPNEVFLTSFSVTPVGSVPEPATWAMMLIGVAGVGAVLRRRRNSGFAAL